MLSFAYCLAIISSSVPSGLSAAAFDLASTATSALEPLLSSDVVLCFLAAIFISSTFIISVLEAKDLLASSKESIIRDCSLISDINMQHGSIHYSARAKRPSIYDEDTNETGAKRIKSPKLMPIEACEQTSQPTQPKHIKSRRNSFATNIHKTIELNVQVQDFKIPLPANDERITLIENDAYDKVDVDMNQLYQNDSKNKPSEWYLRLNLTDDEVEKLSFSEKYRRFYLLNKYDGDVKERDNIIMVQESKKKCTETIKSLSYAEKADQFYQSSHQVKMVVEPPDDLNEPTKVKWGKPLTKVQLRNILYIIN